LYERSDGSGTTGFVIEFVECYGTKYHINSIPTSDEDWNTCYMRTTVMPLILAQLPDEWQEVVATVKIKAGNTVTESDDKLFLPAEREIFASRQFSAQTEWDALTRWQWYAQHDINTDRIKTFDGSAAWWWERSPYRSDSYYFCYVGDDGSAKNPWVTSNRGGVAPAFCL
jgi:hypothetical protein